MGKKSSSPLTGASDSILTPPKRKWRLEKPLENWATPEERQWYCDFIADKTLKKWDAWWDVSLKGIREGRLRSFKGTWEQVNDYWDRMIAEILIAKKENDPWRLLDACDVLKREANIRAREFAQQTKAQSQQQQKKAA